MKKSIILNILFVFFIFSCSKENNEIEKEFVNIDSKNKEKLFEFLNSEDFKSLPYNYSEINPILTRVENVMVEEKTVSIIYVYFGLEKENPKGLLKAIKLTDKNSERKFLPNSNDFAMLYYDFSEYNFISENGKVTISDVNYDNFVFSSFNLKEGKIEKSEIRRINYDILSKYGYIKPNPLRRIPSSCSGGSNGDVSWSECMNCLQSICYSDSSCLQASYLLDAMGIATGRGRLGELAFGVSCVYISMVN